MTISADPSQLASELIAAADNRQPVEPFTVKFSDFSMKQATAVQQAWLAQRVAQGHRPAGKKVGGVKRGWRGLAQALDPGWGYILDSRLILDGSNLPAANLIQPRIEAEFAFLLGRDLSGPGVTAAHALSAIEGVFPAFEIVDSRFRPWAPKPEDLIADNCVQAYAVIGPKLASARDLDLAACAVRLEINDQLMGTGSGARVLGHPIHALVALANIMPLKAGEIILSGSAAGAFPVKGGDRVRAVFEHLGAIALQVES